MLSPNKITVTDICQIFTVTSQEGKTDYIESRKSYGFSFCCKGKITYNLRGKETISAPDYVVFLPAGQSYHLYRNESGEFPLINFLSPDFDCNDIVAFPIRDSFFYLREFEKMKALSLFEYNRAEIMSIFYNMLHQLSRENISKSIITPALRYLADNFSDSTLTNKDLADICNISEVYFRKLFIKFYGTTPKQYLIDIRLNRAQQLLAEGFLPVCDIAEACGFTNQYHFCRLFKDKLGLTPTDYRKRYLSSLF